MKNLTIRDLLFVVAIITSLVLAFTVFSPYINIIVISLVLSQIFQPLYKFFKRTLKSTAIANLLSIISVLILFIVPIGFITYLTINEANTLVQSSGILENLDCKVDPSLEVVQENENIGCRINSVVEEYTTTFESVLDNLSKLNFQTVVDNSQGLTSAITILRDVVSIIGLLLFNIFLLILCLIFFFPMYDRFPQIFSKFSPMDNKFDVRLVERFRDTVKGVITGTFVVALAQATAVIIPMILLGFGAPVLLWLIMVVLSIIPIGSGLVWFPAGVIMIVNGVTTGNLTTVILGVALIVYSAIIINVVDTTLRPKLMKNSINLHPLVTIFSVLGGLGLFGFMGLLYGPLIVVIFMTIIEFYKTSYSEDQKNAN